MSSPSPSANTSHGRQHERNQEARAEELNIFRHAIDSYVIGVGVFGAKIEEDPVGPFTIQIKPNDKSTCEDVRRALRGREPDAATVTCFDDSGTNSISGY